MMKRWAAAAGAALILCVGGALSFPVLAQISSKGGPLDISADTLEVSDATRTSVWKGKVEALQGQNRLRADMLTAYFKSSNQPAAGGSSLGSWGDIDRFEATGNVYFVTPEQTVRGDRATYTVESDTIVIAGNVVIAQGENVVRGDRLTIKVASGQSTMDGQGGRVRGVFYPDKKR